MANRKVIQKTCTNNINNNKRDVRCDVLSYKIFTANNGSITIESAIIIPIVFLSIIFVIFIPFELYGKTSIQAIIDLGALRGASAWDNVNKDITSGEINNNMGNYMGNYNDLYWRLHDRNEDIKKQKLKNWLLSISFKNFQNPDIFNKININQEMIRVELEKHVLFKKVLIETNTGDRRLDATSEAFVTEPAEFIRNVDFLLDIAAEIKKYNPQITNPLEYLKNKTSYIKQKLINDN